MRVSIIVAVSENGVIGRKGEGMPWRIRADLRHFRKVTMGSRIIMGRATFETLPGSLPGRENVVITRQLGFSADGITVVHSLDRALELPVVAANQVDSGDVGDVEAAGMGTTRDGEVFVIGGGQIYRAALERADTLYVTRVHAVVEGDVRFDFDAAEWDLVSEERHEADADNEYPYSFLVYRRREFAA